MLQDLAALTPPLVVCGAFLVGVVLFLRRQMGGGRSAEDREAETDIHGDGMNADADDLQSGVIRRSRYAIVRLGVRLGRTEPERTPRRMR